MPALNHLISVKSFSLENAFSFEIFGWKGHPNLVLESSALTKFAVASSEVCFWAVASGSFFAWDARTPV